jgi:hypothetical protein
MSHVSYEVLSALTPIKLNYTYNTTEPLLEQTTTYNTGLNVNALAGTKNYQDISFNNETCLILTSSVNLNNIFSTLLFENNFFGSVFLRPRNTPLYYLSYNNILNSLTLSLSGTQIYISPVPESKEVELIVERQYVQIEERYPYEVILSDKSLDPESIHRQRFLCTIQDNTVTFKTKTNTGYRYLGMCSDGTLRATGNILNDAVFNDYVFNIDYVAVNTGVHGFIPVNDYITYYFDIESGVNNKNLTINKTFSDNPNNYLLSFTFHEIVNNNTTNINIANLKNVVTPAGSLATVDNSYSKEPLLSN